MRFITYSVMLLYILSTPLQVSNKVSNGSFPNNKTEAIRKNYQWESLPVTADGTFKSYMDGSSITDVTSSAYNQIQKMSIVNGLYVEDGYVGIALSSFYGNVGDKFRITLSEGQIFYAVMTDTKKDEDVDGNYAHKTDGSVIEFVVDIETLDDQARIEGSLDCIYEGSIVKIERRIGND